MTRQTQIQARRQNREHYVEEVSTVDEARQREAAERIAELSASTRLLIEEIDEVLVGQPEPES